MNPILMTSSLSNITRPPHSHDEFELFYCGAGFGTMEVSGERYEFKQGDLICIPPNVMHYDYSDSPRINCIAIFPKESWMYETQVRIYHDSAGTYYDLHRLAYETQLAGGLNANALVFALANSMLQLIRSWGYEKSKDIPAIEHIKSSIFRNFTDCHYDLAAEIDAEGYSPNYFRQIFREATGKPPLSFLNNIRIEYAKNQIHFYGDTLPIKEIARSSGFANPYYFSRIFKKTVGMSPQAYLQQVTNS